jgi:hypothetical protein
MAMNKNTATLAVILAIGLGLAFLWKRNQLDPEGQTKKLARIQEQMELNRRNQKNRLEARVSPEAAKFSSERQAAPGADTGQPDNKNRPGLQFEGSSPSSQQLMSDPANAVEKESVTNLANFSATAKLQVPVIPGMQFVPYDYDDGVLAVRGVDVSRDMELTLFAKQGMFSEEQLKEYLKNYPDGIPGLEGMSGVQLDAAKSIELDAGSGLGSVKYWTVQNGSKTVYLALLPRKDGQGTYFASLKGSAEFEAAEEMYYETLIQLRATN